MDVLSLRLPKHTTRVSVPATLLQSLQWQVSPQDMDAMVAQLSGTVLVRVSRGGHC